MKKIIKANTVENSVHSVHYKTHQGRGRPSLGKVVHHNIVCVEIENLNTHERVFIPVNEVSTIRYLETA